MSILKTHNLQSPDAGSVNIVMTPNAGMIVAGLSTYSNQINVGSNIKIGNAGVITATSFVGSGDVDINGDLDVDGHTNLDNVSIAGDITITSIDANATGPTLKLFHNSGSPAANDVVSRISMFGDDSAGNETEYGRIETKVDNVTDSQETGFLNFATRGLGSFANVFRIKRRSTGSAPSYTADDADGIILDVYNTGNPYPRYMNFIAKSAGNTDSNIAFWTEAVGGSPTEKLRIDSSGHVSLRNSASSHQEIQWYRNTNKYASIGWGDGSANWEFKHFRADNQANNPYANIDFFTGSTTSPTRALRITEDGNHIREKHSRFSTRIAYSTGNESASTKIPMHEPHINVGSDFSNSNDRYTAPVDGDYVFYFFTNVTASSSRTYWAEFRKNGAQVYSTLGGIMYDYFPGSGWVNLSGCQMLSLDEGDYVEVWNGTSVVNYDGNNYGQFMGWLIG